MTVSADFVLRPARADELGDVAAVILAAYDEYMPGESASEERRASFAEYREDMADVRERAERGAVALVAERDGRIIGTVSYFPPGTDKSGEGWPDAFAGIRLLAVLPAERRHGLGRSLTEECIRRAREAGAPAVGLHTTELMWIARDMYERMGFVRVPEYDFSVPELLITAYRLDLS